MEDFPVTCYLTITVVRWLKSPVTMIELTHVYVHVHAPISRCKSKEDEGPF